MVPLFNVQSILSHNADILSNTCYGHHSPVGRGGLDFVAPPGDIAIETRLALVLTNEIEEITERVATEYRLLIPAES